MARFHVALRCRRELFMLHKDYVSTGENLYFPSRMCKRKVCPTTKRRKAKEIQVVGQLHITANIGTWPQCYPATARRAWLFADTPKGAFANGVLYTLVESARANNLDVYEYLKYLLTEMPNNHHLEHPEIIDRYLPWSPELPDTCRLKIRNKKCFKWICSEYNKKTSVMHYAFFWSTYVPSSKLSTYKKLFKSSTGYVKSMKITK